MSINTKELIKSSKVWNVRNINTIAKPLGNDYYISSAPFKNNSYSTISWQICIYLNGYQGGIYGSVNVSLRQMGLKGNDCVKAKYYFYAIQNNGLRMDIGRASHNFNYWTQTSRYNVNMQSLLQHDGSITLGCEVEFTLEDLTLEYIKKDESALYSKALLQNMWQNKEFMDCVIEIGEVSINAHRSVLAQNSEVFRRMLYTSGMSEAQNGIVKITDCSSECFQAMLEYCYTGIISDDIMNSHAEELFAVSHKYEISPLKEKCENYIASYIGVCDISRICQIVQLYGSLILEKAVAKCISQNRDILTTTEWNNLKRSYGELTHRLLESVIFGHAK